jgi:DNA polymerase III alpha subunit (gram-positive type)
MIGIPGVGKTSGHTELYKAGIIAPHTYATINLDKIISDMLGDVDISSSIIEHKVDASLNFPEPIHLHMHSKYSHTDSLPSIKSIVEWCLETKTPGFSVVDHGMAASLFEMM